MSQNNSYTGNDSRCPKMKQILFLYWVGRYTTVGLATH